MSVKLLTEHNLEFLSLIGGCTVSSESTHVKMPHCWKSHITAHISASKQKSGAYSIMRGEGVDNPFIRTVSSETFLLAYRKSRCK